MKAIIMAGGQGVRLRPLTCSVPKPLAKLCGRPVVHYILDLLDLHNFTEAVFTLGYKGEQIEDLFETGRYKGINLSFSSEDTPLGTAGCVRRAVGTRYIASARADTADTMYGVPTEPILVISGDALCDFDLTAAMEYHKANNAAATIITKQVDDPREYGLVLADDSGKITGFSEKPSYLGCIADAANTGVYILSPKVLELVPDNAQCDFARDVFPAMLQRAMSLFAYEESGYWCDIGDFSTYKQSQLDMMKGENFIGQNVNIGENCDITSSIIGANVTIGNNVKLRKSVILDNVFISDGVTVNEAIICAGSKLLHSASVYEDAVIGENCLIGREAIIHGGVRVWNEKSIPNGANVTKDIKYGSKSEIELSDEGDGNHASVITGETNTEITPEFCATLGAALAAVVGEGNPSAGRHGSASIAVACEGDNASIAMKQAVTAGISGAGADVFDLSSATLPQLIYAAKMLDCSAIARIKCSIFTKIEIFGRGGLPLTRLEERRFEAALSRGEFKNADRNSFGEIQSFMNFETVYNSMLSRYARFKSNYRVKVNSENKSLVPVFDSISSPRGEMLVVTLTDGGSKAEIYTQSNNKVDYEQLVLIATASLVQSGLDVALPHEFSSSADMIAKSHARRIHRYFRCSNDSSDAYARELALRQAFLHDGAILALNVLEYLSRNSVTIENAVKALPHFACERREVQINCPPQRIISRLCKSGCGNGEGVLINENHGNILIRSGKRGKSLFLVAQGLSSETAAELCDNTEKMIKTLDKNKKAGYN